MMIPLLVSYLGCSLSPKLFIFTNDGFSSSLVVLPFDVKWSVRSSVDMIAIAGTPTHTHNRTDEAFSKYKQRLSQLLEVFTEDLQSVELLNREIKMRKRKSIFNHSIFFSLNCSVALNI